MASRIREAMKNGSGPLGGSGSPVEVDETYWWNKKRKGAFKEFGSRGAGPHHQMKVVTRVERGGKGRSLQLPKVYGGVLREVLYRNIVPGASIHTDESKIHGAIRLK